MRDRSRIRHATCTVGLLRFLGVHIARLVAIWLTGIVVYAAVFVRPIDPLWLGVDVALIGGCTYASFRRDVWIAGTISLVAVLISQLVIVDKNGVWVDESHYLATLRDGIQLDGTSPFNLRWLAPILAGLDVFAARDADALKALNFGALVTTGTYLAWFLLRIGVARWLAFVSPLLLLSSYLGIYASTNRLVLDPFNYAIYTLVAHALVRHIRYVPWILLVGAFNSEKVIYWIPVVAVAEYLRGGRAIRTAAIAAAPTVLYLAVMFILTRDAKTDDHGVFVQQLHRLAFSPLPVAIRDPTAAATTMQMLWFPFGAITIFSLLALVDCERWLKALPVLLLPVLAQPLIATDTQRMTAYAFVVFLPLGALFLTQQRPWLVRVFITVVVAQHYLLPTCRLLREHGIGAAKFVLRATPTLQPTFAALEILLAATIVWLHLTSTQRVQPSDVPSTFESRKVRRSSR